MGAKIIKELAFSWQGIAAVLDAVKPAGVMVPQQLEMESNSAKLREQEFSLLMGELEYDLKSFKVWQRKLQNFDIRVLSQKDDWLMKRHAAAKAAMEVYMESKVGLGGKPTIHKNTTQLLYVCFQTKATQILMASFPQVGRMTWPDKFGTGSAAHGVLVDMLNELKKDMDEWMQRKKLSKQVTWNLKGLLMFLCWPLNLQQNGWEKQSKCLTFFWI